MTSAGSAAEPQPGLTVPGWALRGLLAACVVLVVVLTLLGGSGTGALTVAGLVLLAAGAATVAKPDSAGAVFLLLIAMGVHLLFDGPEIDVGVALLAAAIAAVHQAAGICATVPLSSTVDVRALRPAALRLLLAVAIVEVGIVVVAVVGAGG